MKTNLLLLFGLGLLISSHSKAQLTFTNLNLEAQHADVSLVDLDNDGDLDLLISGETGGGDTYAINMTAYLNNGAGVFTPTTVPFKPVSRGSFDWNDINQDGKIDFLENGFAFGTGPFTGIFTSTGTGTFAASSISLPQMSPSSGFADFNNDGYLDIYLFGNQGQHLVGDTGAVQGKSHIYFNDKMGGFTDSHLLDAYTFTFDPDVTVVDFNNDKYLDLFISAGVAGSGGTRYSRLLKNNGNSTFTEMQVTTTEKGYGSSVWGDYDGDGYLDLLLNGDGMDPENVSNYKLYKNNAGLSFTEKARYDYRQGSTGDGGRFLDWDNDGDLDFVITGYIFPVGNVPGRQATDIYLNNGSGTFTAYANNMSTPGVSESSIEIGDVDNDGDLDIVETGYSGNDFDGAGTVGPFNKNVSILLKNPAILKNTPPTSPANLIVTGSQAQLNFSWSAAIDATTPQASLSYNMYLVNDQGKTFMFPLADTATGKLKLQRLGNVQLNKGWIIKGLPAGNYTWGVQAIDNSFAGSPFTKSSFTISSTGVLPVSLLSYAVKAEDNKVKISWSTAAEQNTDYYEVQRSADGRNFTKLSAVKASGTGSYFVYDNSPVKGTNYYRLISYDKDGTLKDNGVKTINFAGLLKAVATVYPNPANAQIGIRLSNFGGKQLTVIVSDMNGKAVHTETIAVSSSEGYYPLHLTAKPASGQYIINVSGDGLKESLKLMVK